MCFSKLNATRIMKTGKWLLKFIARNIYQVIIVSALFVEEKFKIKNKITIICFFINLDWFAIELFERSICFLNYFKKAT